jgi:hypothetical protein
MPSAWLPDRSGAQAPRGGGRILAQYARPALLRYDAEMSAEIILSHKPTRRSLFRYGRVMTRFFTLTAAEAASSAEAIDLIRPLPWAAPLALQLQFFLEMGPARIGLMSPAPGGPSK